MQIGGITVPESILEHCESEVRIRLGVEYAIVKKTVDILLGAGFTLYCYHANGEIIQIPSSSENSMAELFAHDEVRLYVRDGIRYVGWVFFVFGNNGYDVINDHTTNLGGILKPVDKYADQFS